MVATNCDWETAFSACWLCWLRHLITSQEPIPVIPTVHYNMGGIPTNYRGQVFTRFTLLVLCMLRCSRCTFQERRSAGFC